MHSIILIAFDNFYFGEDDTATTNYSECKLFIQISVA